VSNFDKRATDELHSRTDKHLQVLKDQIWQELEQELFSEDPIKRSEVKKLKKRNYAIPLIITVAAGLLIAFSLQTDTGTAFVKEIKEMFVPEKQIIQNIEGTDEETEVQLNEGKDSEYIIYVDETRYELKNGENSDVITTINPLPENYPEVTMEIRQVADEKPEDLVNTIEAELKNDFPELREVEEVTEPVTGYNLHGAAGNEADSKIVNAYVISNGQEGSFVITQYYFLEAAEGHGARFHRMLETFEIVK
jgi:predicted small secreted protein